MASPQDLNSNSDLNLKYFKKGRFDLDLSSLTGFEFDVDLHKWWICAPLIYTVCMKKQPQFCTSIVLLCTSIALTTKG